VASWLVLPVIQIWPCPGAGNELRETRAPIDIVPDADGDAGAAGYESEPDIDPGLADLATRVSSAFKGSKVV
jgi:hypothetical protein